MALQVKVKFDSRISRASPDDPSWRCQVWYPRVCGWQDGDSAWWSTGIPRRIAAPFASPRALCNTPLFVVCERRRSCRTYVEIRLPCPELRGLRSIADTRSISAGHSTNDADHANARFFFFSTLIVTKSAIRFDLFIRVWSSVYVSLASWW